ncbi:MAG: adenosine kinase [Alphaproteobacteria bacterium]|nr:adenosine kinase [Alphaproteobacteria bacterium]
MASKSYDVVAIGNAIVDVLSFCDDRFLAEQEMRKGSMQLIDAARAELLYGAMGQATEVSGGSAANTLAGMADLGAKTAFIGKVHADELGRVFRHDMNAIGVEFTTPEATNGVPTARCLIAVTEDGQRTMNTFLGAAGEIHVSDVDTALIAQSKIFYGEGYMWDLDVTKAALRHAFAAARTAGTQIAFTLSDVFCVERSRADYLAMIRDDFDILFCNYDEAQALYPGQSFEQVLGQLQGQCAVIAVTCGSKGSIILTPQARIEVAAVPVHEVVDTTGAGDLYAAGFLYGHTRGLPLEECGRLGSACASDIITHLGARAQKPLKRLLVA